MSTPVKHRAVTTQAMASATRLGRRRARRLIRGATSYNPAPMIFLGAILIVVGIFCNGQGWTTPETFKGLELNLAQTITNLGLLLVFWKVIEFYFYKPLKAAMDSRNSELEETFAEAESLKAQMTQMRSDYEARLAKTEADAREQIQAQIKEAQTLRQTLMAEATVKADELLRKAEQDIESERHRLRSELRAEVVTISLKATEVLIGKNVDSDVNRKLVQEFIEGAAVVS